MLHFLRQRQAAPLQLRQAFQLFIPSRLTSDEDLVFSLSGNLKQILSLLISCLPRNVHNIYPWFVWRQDLFLQFSCADLRDFTVRHGAKDVGQNQCGKVFGLVWTRGMVCVYAQLPRIGMFRGSVGHSSSSSWRKNRWSLVSWLNSGPASQPKQSRHVLWLVCTWWLRRMSFGRTVTLLLT